MTTAPDNDEVASALEAVAKLLAAQGANPFRVKAYENAARTVRMEALPGFGDRRVRLLRDVLAARLSRSARRRVRRVGHARPPEPSAEIDRPDVGTILDVDVQYRRGVAEGTLRRIAPRRFNPTKEAWLPVLHAERGPWSFTAMFSNTARPHELGTTRDWVVLYFERDGHEDQCTVVTETSGPDAGRRVVRGREIESRAWYATSMRASGGA